MNPTEELKYYTDKLEELLKQRESINNQIKNVRRKLKTIDPRFEQMEFEI